MTSCRTCRMCRLTCNTTVGGRDLQVPRLRVSCSMIEAGRFKNETQDMVKQFHHLSVCHHSRSSTHGLGHLQCTMSLADLRFWLQSKTTRYNTWLQRCDKHRKQLATDSGYRAAMSTWSPEMRTNQLDALGLLGRMGLGEAFWCVRRIMASLVLGELEGGLRAQATAAEVALATGEDGGKAANGWLQFCTPFSQLGGGPVAAQDRTVWAQSASVLSGFEHDAGYSTYQGKQPHCTTPLLPQHACTFMAASPRSHLPQAHAHPTLVSPTNVPRHCSVRCAMSRTEPTAMGSPSQPHPPASTAATEHRDGRA